ncbi:MAG: hypothetical protein K2X77_34150 [Candidatus Obscuribacterales bacterium]|nr:hypothetical protein [Candidatus Obscuribacterales bacterium]
MKLKLNRKQGGATLALVAATGSILALVVAGICVLAMILGGGREINNATDAGALNVGKKIFTDAAFKVKRDRSQYNDVSDKNGEFGLANINAVWGRALLAQANAAHMQEEGLAGNALQDADRLFSEAESINDELARKLQDQRRKAPIFEELAQQNSLRMLGAEVQIRASGDEQGWGVSLMDRGRSSNLEVPTSDLLPAEAQYQSLAVHEGKIPGYTPLQVGRKTFCFVPFVEKERNHLVSISEFNSNTLAAKPLNGPDWRIPIPNAYSCQGTCVDKLNLKHVATACVLTNPQKDYKLSMPHTFIHIRLEKNEAKWLFNSPDPRIGGFDVALVEKESRYPNRLTLSNKSGEGGSALDGDLKANLLPLGKEYTLTPTLDKAIFGSELEAGDSRKLEKALLVRVNQMLSKPGKKASAADLHALLSRAETGAAMQDGEDQDYYVYSADGAELAVSRKADALARAPWLAELIANEADGQEANSYARLTSELILPPGIVMIDPLPGANIVVPPFGRMNIEINDKWQPGSGYDGCLGRLRVCHKSTIMLWGVAVVPAAPGAGGLVKRVFDAIF